MAPALGTGLGGGAPALAGGGRCWGGPRGAARTLGVGMPGSGIGAGGSMGLGGSIGAGGSIGLGGSIGAGGATAAGQPAGLKNSSRAPAKASGTGDGGGPPGSLTQVPGMLPNA